MRWWPFGLEEIIRRSLCLRAEPTAPSSPWLPGISSVDIQRGVDRGSGENQLKNENSLENSVIRTWCLRFYRCPKTGMFHVTTAKPRTRCGRHAPYELTILCTECMYSVHSIIVDKTHHDDLLVSNRRLWYHLTRNSEPPAVEESQNRGLLNIRKDVLFVQV